MALNELAGRVEVLLAAERESVADLSHRLRTPLTALRLRAEAVDDPEKPLLRCSPRWIVCSGRWMN